MPSRRGHLQRAEGAWTRPTLQERTGLQIDPMFSASKIRWLLDHIPDGQARPANGELCAGNVDAGCSGT